MAFTVTLQNDVALGSAFVAVLTLQLQPGTWFCGATTIVAQSSGVGANGLFQLSDGQNILSTFSNALSTQIVNPLVGAVPPAIAIEQSQFTLSLLAQLITSGGPATLKAGTILWATQDDAQPLAAILSAVTAQFVGA